ncbi:hypothetical protein [Paeniglutamicibacter psychrophenolicus]|uniref:Uncharacterized protein n=1 Tax=Paeniglutamicibacter psychrophenolicus TaxID=257454 RepID=A0ABS4WIN8_9MICC|nr:hypothetical protein [Paeniglutamicibacter psychrophenolicus]MBP2375818.1 hypothetical protein [Paeniglutamicibacter psychrophenolicus]
MDLASGVFLIGSPVFCVAGVVAGFVDAFLVGAVVSPAKVEPVEVLVSAAEGLVAPTAGFAASFSKAAVAAFERPVLWAVGLVVDFSAGLAAALEDLVGFTVVGDVAPETAGFAAVAGRGVGAGLESAGAFGLTALDVEAVPVFFGAGLFATLLVLDGNLATVVVVWLRSTVSLPPVLFAFAVIFLLLPS